MKPLDLSGSPKIFLTSSWVIPTSIFSVAYFGPRSQAIRNASAATNKTYQKTLQRICVVLLFVVVSAIFLRMIWGFLLAVFMAAILAGLTYPNPGWKRLAK